MNKSSWKEVVETKHLVFYLILDQKNILTTSGDCIHLLRFLILIFNIVTFMFITVLDIWVVDSWFMMLSNHFFLELKGDTLKRWRTEPFIMLTGSGRYNSYVFWIFLRFIYILVNKNYSLIFCLGGFLLLCRMSKAQSMINNLMPLLQQEEAGYVIFFTTWY